MNKTIVILVISILAFTKAEAQKDSLRISIETNEYWWSGVVDEGYKMPLQQSSVYSLNMYGDCKSNQAQPLLISNKGRYIWSEEPISYEVKNNTMFVRSAGQIKSGKSGNTLKEAVSYLNRNYFPPSGKLPDSFLMSRPQYNTWIELNYNHNQADILKYAHAIIDNGLPPGVFMIDDTWQEDYGIWDFHPGRFPNPKAMMDELHAMGFKVMVWLAPFMSPDQAEYRKLKKVKAFLLAKREGETGNWADSKAEPILIQWWNGASAVLDFTNPEAVKWFDEQLDRLVKKYQVDGFKFDAGDANFYTGNFISKEKISPNKHTETYAKFGLKYPLNEYRACWKMGGQPLVQRLADKNHSWEDVRKLIPNMLLEGMVGYYFSCPDMIGGGEIVSFWGLQENLDQALVVRSAQCHALMPMMQFSVAPWRILDSIHLQAVKEAVALRMKFTPLILELAKHAAATGVPIVRHMDYVFPDQGFAMVNNQFMLGDSILVAPMLEKNQMSRNVLLPKGNWQADDGKKYKGGTTITTNVPLNRLPYFKRVN